MAGMGPAPKPAGTRQRRNATITTFKLPSGGRVGNAPEWPLPDDAGILAEVELLEAKVDELGAARDIAHPRSLAKIERELDKALRSATILRARVEQRRVREQELWGKLWSTPQAHAWEQLGWVNDVAMYVRHMVAGELGSLDDAKEARQWSDRLGLNPLAMLRLRWETERVAQAEDQGRRRRGATPAKKAAAKRTDPRRALSAVK